MKKLFKKIFPVLMIVAVPAFADGFTKANALLLKVQTGLAGLSIITVTLAALWVGYKVLFDGQSLRDCKGGYHWRHHYRFCFRNRAYDGVNLIGVACDGLI